MKDFAVSAENLGKRYFRKRSHLGETSLKEAISTKTSRFLRRFIRNRFSVDGDEESFWALRNVSFDLERGKALGVIGKNGSGKSTLLKILARTTKPTEGQATIVGRVGALLEVGTGFHPELTGQENVYFYGAVLGMRKNEIDCIFTILVIL